MEPWRQYTLQFQGQNIAPATKIACPGRGFPGLS